MNPQERAFYKVEFRQGPGMNAIKIAAGSMAHALQQFNAIFPTVEPLHIMKLA